MKDYIIRATAAKGTVRAFAAVTSKLVDEAREIHGLYPIPCAALGRTLTVAAMMSLTLKGENDALTVQFSGDGPLGGLVVVTDAKANVRGYVNNPTVDLPNNSQGKLNVGAAIGKGRLNVIKDIGLRDCYNGHVRIVTGEIAEDLTAYYAYSEQIPTAISLGVLINKDGTVINSGGFMIQLMPDASETTIQKIEEKISELSSVTTLLLEGKSPEDILELVLGELELKLGERSDCAYKCNCSRERMERNLISLGVQELKDILTEQAEAETQCHFCNSKYLFNKADLTEMIEELTK